MIPTGTDFVGAILAKNTGQVIWSQQNTLVGFENGNVKVKDVYMNEIEPMRLGLIYFKSNSPDTAGVYSDKLFITNERNEKITTETKIESYIINLKKVQIEPIFAKIRASISF